MFLYLLIIHVTIMGCVTLLALPYGGIGEASCHWDCSDAYLRIVRNGYDHAPSLSAQWVGEANWAFFPAFPLTLRAMMWMTGLSGSNAGIVLNGLLLPVLAYLCYLYQNKKWGPVDYRIYFLFFLTFPPTLWFRIQYTECMFGILLVGMAWSVLNNRFYLASLCATLLCLTRPTGIFCVLIFAAFYLFNAWQNIDNHHKRVHSLGALVAPAIDSTFLVVSGGAGMSVFMIYLYYLTGDSLAFSHIQIGWSRHFHFPGYWLLENIKYKHHINLVIASILDMVVIYKGFQKRFYVEATVLLVTFMLAFSSSLMSIHRIIMANPFFFMIVYSCLMDMRPIVRKAFIGFFGIILLLITILWFHNTNLLY